MLDTDELTDYGYIGENIARIRENIAGAKEKSPYRGDVTLLLATKYATPAEILAAAAYGVRDVGENRVQQLLEKYDGIKDAGLNIHFIGRLQTNKVKYIADKVTMIHSLDSVPLAAEIERRCAALGRTMDVLIEVNIGNEEAKGGISPAGLFPFYDAIADFGHLRVRGLMTMAPKCGGKEEFRKYFEETYTIFLDFCEKKIHNIRGAVLSMGMSDSYDVAVEEGATLVRVGHAAFEKKEN